MVAKKGINLTEKQTTFCNEYIIDFNATRSAKAAGYSESSSGSIGSENLMKPEIQAYLKTLKRKRSKQTKITQKRVLKELAAIAFGNIAEILAWDDKGVKIKNSEDLTESQQRFVSSISETTTIIGGKDGGKTKKLKINTCQKEKALALLMEHLGMKQPEEKPPQPISINIRTTGPEKETTASEVLKK